MSLAAKQPVDFVTLSCCCDSIAFSHWQYIVTVIMCTYGCSARNLCSNFSLCRKLKNRVAAQTARDRKRLKMETLEETVQKVQQQVGAGHSTM